VNRPKGVTIDHVLAALEHKPRVGRPPGSKTRKAEEPINRTPPRTRKIVYEVDGEVREVEFLP